MRIEYNNMFSLDEKDSSDNNTEIKENEKKKKQNWLNKPHRYSSEKHFLCNWGLKAQWSLCRINCMVARGLKELAYTFLLPEKFFRAL